MAGRQSFARIRPLAASDLESIVRYLDENSETAADKFLAEFSRSAQILADMPRLGTIRRARGKLKGVRSWPLTSFGPYILFYFPHADGVEILRIFHGARNLERELRKGLS